MSAEYLQVAETLKRRLIHGDYLNKPIPPSRRLADELGASHIVVRGALEKLINEGWLQRIDRNGRLKPIRGNLAGVSRGHLAILAPAFPSGYFNLCLIAIQRAIADSQALLRPVVYAHWEDPVIEDTLEGFDGIFLAGDASPIPDKVRETLGRRKQRLVTLDLDLTDVGVPCLSIFNPECVSVLLEYVRKLGHIHIDCLNTQPTDRETLARIEAWRQFITQHQLAGTLHNFPVKPYEHPILQARKLMSDLLKNGSITATALFTTNCSTARGVMRAMTDMNLRPGPDLAVCTINDDGEGLFYTPSITSVEMPDITGSIQQMIEWFKTGDKWSGPLMLQPDNTPLFIGESTKSKIA